MLSMFILKISFELLIIVLKVGIPIFIACLVIDTWLRKS